MFYGTVISENLNKEEKFLARLVAATEVSSLMRNTDVFEGYSTITTGRWIVTGDLSLATVIDPSLTYHKPYLENLKDKYVKFLHDAPAEIRENTIKLLQFLSSVINSKKVYYSFYLFQWND